MGVGDYLSIDSDTLHSDHRSSQLFTTMASSFELLTALRKLSPISPDAALLPGDLELVVNQVDRRPIASIGWNATGSLLHSHDCAWLYLGQGRKDWLLLPPSFDWKPLMEADPCSLVRGAWDGSSSHARIPGAVVCQQEAGDVVLVPNGWSHATCNEASGLTVGWGAQGDVSSWRPIHRAARDGREESASAGPGKDRTDVEPLLLAAEHGHVPFLKALLAARRAADPPIKDTRATAAKALVAAATNGHPGAVGHLLGAFRGIALGPCGAPDTPLHEAARRGHAEVCRTILEWAAPSGSGGAAVERAGFTCVGRRQVQRAPAPAVHAVNPQGATALHHAARCGHAEVVGLLLEARASALGDNAFGATPLHQAAIHGPAAVVARLLAAAGPQEVAAADRNGRSPLHQAALYGHGGVVEALLREPRLRAAAELGDKQGLRPAEIAAGKGHAAAVSALASAGTSLGDALHWAAYHGHGEAAGRLLDLAEANQSLEGALLRLNRQAGATPLHLAAAAGHVAVARLLLGHARRGWAGGGGVDAVLGARDARGLSPEEVARAQGWAELSRALQPGDAAAEGGEVACEGWRSEARRPEKPPAGT
ncbi:unnamed protein product [Prorocentrum cordatum]|uniref:JmjC domain-containing protein n=1 Tax=Prorocentrum cordatum TaxID=2364126 RepID=A0ABN9XUQ5_9DINO|nr:unnamed protein product [Polarella glacialis]